VNADQTLVDVISEWSYFDKEPLLGVGREILTSLTAPSNDLVTVIQGVRRCGKSTLLAQIMEHFALPRAECFFVNFEDPRLSDRLNPALLDEICRFAHLRCGAETKRYFFFDEIQNVEDWPKWFHKKLARPGNEYFYVSGSNAALLSGKVASALTGRHLSGELFPFSYRELGVAFNAPPSLGTFIEKGGFPRAATFEQPAQLLRQYLTDIVERDVRRNLELQSATVIFQLVKLVFESLGSEVSQRSLSRTLGIAPDTVGTYLGACEAAYLILRCPYFTYSERQRLVRNRKYYPIDVALRQALVGTGRVDSGKNLEAMVFLHLRRKYPEIAYWRDHGEIDFVISVNHSIVPIQVSWEGAQDRHHQAVEEFRTAFPRSEDAVMIDRNNVFEQLERLGV
jgi:uncharacterized protein